MCAKASNAHTTVQCSIAFLGVMGTALTCFIVVLLKARYEVAKGSDLFISVWNLHRSPQIWQDPMGKWQLSGTYYIVAVVRMRNCVKCTQCA